ncbi:MAG: RagB/SusD family nutrient uptake outer membrane protein [Flavobacteriaceae bacterium]|nr:MAG: RagB/SusD family nutrient uptake outer membrane protein [Flavobacteriaceae bacterium]
MKKINYIHLLIGLILVTFTSCQDFMEYNESSTLNKELAFSNMERASKVALYSYTYMQDNFGNAMRSSACDESQYVWPSNAIHNYNNGSWSSFATIDDKWAHYYAGIQACNNFLENGADKTFEDYQYHQDFENAYLNYQNLKWEVRALRAFYHFELVKRYGDIPLINTVLSIDEANSVVQTPAKEVIQWIASECQTSFNKLPDSYDYTGNYFQGQAGRITKLFVKALESRALLYGASPLYNNGTYDTKLLRSSAKASLDVIETMEGNGVNLAFIPYFNLWNSDGNKHAKNPSIIASIRRGSTNKFERENFPISMEGGKTGNCPTQNLVDAYGMQSGFTYDPANPYANRDPRLKETIVVNQSNWAYNNVMDISYGGADGLPNKGATQTGYYLKKFAMKNTNLSPNGTTTHKMIWIQFRLAEMYLNYTEAANQINGVTGTDGDLYLSAIDAINSVRARKNLNIDPISAALSSDDFEEKYRKERMVELAFEDHRFWDIRRWMIGESTNTIKIMSIEKGENNTYLYTPQISVFNRIWDNKFYFYPINQKELDINIELVQNPGW